MKPKPKEETTTQRVFKRNMFTIRKWMKIFNMSFAELIDEWIRVIDLRCKERMYNKLSPIINYKPRLSDCKIKKYKGCIQKRVATYN